MVRAVAGQPARVARRAIREVDDRPDPNRVMVPAHEHRGPRRRADARRVEVREAQPFRGETVDRRRLDRRSVTTELGETHVVEHDEHDVGTIRRQGCSAHGTERVTVRASVQSEAQGEASTGHSENAGDAAGADPQVSFRRDAWKNEKAGHRRTEQGTKRSPLRFRPLRWCPAVQSFVLLQSPVNVRVAPPRTRGPLRP